MNVLADASLPGLTQAFPMPFHLTQYHHPDELAHLLPGQDVLFCRSTLKVNQTLLRNHCLRYVATASSGTDHLDSMWLNSQNIGIIDAKGSNARSVADYVVACLAFLQQQRLIAGNQAGIIGMGKVGTAVTERLQAADFQTLTYDPLRAIREPRDFQSCTLEELYEVDLLCIHAELHNTQPYPSVNLINRNVLALLKSNCIIINAARGVIINEKDLLNHTRPLIYCTDVYLNEPSIDKRIIDKALLCTPHIAGHSLEAKFAAVTMISEKLHQLAGVPIPLFAQPEMSHTPRIKENAPWYELLLEIYNPFDETLQLKQALDIKTTFLNLRNNHQKRHDFSRYPLEFIPDSKNGLLLGK
ncbi:MAG: NAD(P)-dependent oxidoreductase [Legionella sp.]